MISFARSVASGRALGAFVVSRVVRWRCSAAPSTRRNPSRRQWSIIVLLEFQLTQICVRLLVFFRRLCALQLDDLFEQAQSAEEAGDIAEAERLYRLLMKCDPTDASAPFNLGNLLRASARSVEVEAAFRAATRTDPTFADAWYNLGDLRTSRDALKRHRVLAHRATARASPCRCNVQSCTATATKKSIRRGR
jgi:tetratricopeptide (TPR) repeat protein